MTYEFTGWNYEPMVRQGPVNAVLFTVEGEPMVKARPRMTKTGHTYTPQVVESSRFLANPNFRHLPFCFHSCTLRNIPPPFD